MRSEMDKTPQVTGSFLEEEHKSIIEIEIKISSEPKKEETFFSPHRKIYSELSSRGEDVVAAECFSMVE